MGANLWLVFYIVIIRLSVFLFPMEWAPSQSGILSYHAYDAVGTNGWLSSLTAILLILVQAFLINLLSARFRISKEVTMIPGAFYILMMSTMPDFLKLTPVLLGNTFLILALMNLFQTHKKSSVAGSVFNSGFWIGVASLFYFSNIVFVLLAIAGVATLRALRLSELLMVIIGAIIPYFLAGTMAFLIDNLSIFHHLQIEDNLGFLSFDWQPVWQNYATLGIFGFLSLIAFASFGTYFQKQSIQAQRYIQILYYFIIIATLTVFVQQGIRPSHLMLLAIPLSLLLPLNFLSLKNKNLASTIHIIWVILVLGIQYKILWIDKVG